MVSRLASMRAVIAPRWLFFLDWREYGKYLVRVSIYCQQLKQDGQHTA